MNARVGRLFRHESGEQLGWALAASLGVHLLLLTAMIFWRSWGPNKAELFAPTYQVQLVGMSGSPAAALKAPPASRPAPPAPKPEPKPQVKEIPKPEPQPKPKEAIATKPEVVKKRSEPKPTEPSLDAVKELEKRLASLQSKASDQKRLGNVMSRLEEKAATRQNRVGGAFTSGPAGSGGASGTPSVRDQVYLTELWQRIQAAWVLSEVLVQKPKGLVAIVGIRLKADGSLERAWLEQSSGNARFDQSAVRATEKAAPYPPPPGDLRELGIRFRVEDVTG
ncbi:periplasmic protein TonB [Desulfarculales bacterium]